MLFPFKYYKAVRKKMIGYSIFISHLLVLFENKLIAKVNHFDKVFGLLDLTLQTLH